MDTVKGSLEALMREVMEGTPPDASGTWFVQGSEAISATLTNLTAAQASIRLCPKTNSIAAHVIHSTYYLELAIDGLSGVERSGDWAGSWSIQVVDDAQWGVARERLRSLVDQLLARIEEADFEGHPLHVTYALANLGHLAYHLGAIRQLYLLVS